MMGLVGEFLLSDAVFCLIPPHLRLGGMDKAPAYFSVSCGRNGDTDYDSLYSVCVFEFFSSRDIYYRVYKPTVWEEYHYITKGPHPYYGTPRGEVLFFTPQSRSF